MKQIPDSTARLSVTADGLAVRSDGLTWIPSPYDEFGIEMALQWKDRDPLARVQAVCIGPARSRDVLRRALAMGCDDALLVATDEPVALDGRLAARLLAAVASESKPDVVFCGGKAGDDEQGYVGVALAEELGWPHVGAVSAIAAATDGVIACREVEGGYERWHAPLPVILTTQKGANEPRNPSLTGILKAKKREITERTLAGYGLSAADVPAGPAVLRLTPPPPRGGGTILRGDDPRRLAAELVALLRDEAKVLVSC